MAAYQVARSKHATLTAATVDTVTFQERHPAVEVVNRAAEGDIYFTVDGTAPVSAANDTYFVGPGQAVLVDLPHATDPDAVKLISAGTPAYSVTGVRA